MINMKSMQAAALSAAKTFGEMGESIMEERILDAHRADEKFNISYIMAHLYKAVSRITFYESDNGSVVCREETNDDYILAESMTAALEMVERNAPLVVDSLSGGGKGMFMILSIELVEEEDVMLSDKVAAAVWSDEES